MKSVLTKIVPYASFPYADHALREVGVEDPNIKAETTDEHIDLLIEAANALRAMVRDMEDLDDIKGFITYSAEEARERPPIPQENGEDAAEQTEQSADLQQEA